MFQQQSQARISAPKSAIVLMPYARIIALACSVAVILLSVAAPARADDGDGGWPKPKPAAKPSPASPATNPKPATPSDESEAQRLKREGREVFGPGSRGTGEKRADAASTTSEGWAIVLAAYRGESAQDEARQGLDRVRSEGGLPEAFISKRNASWVIVVGSFASPDDEQARAELQRVQQIEVGSSRPYSLAFLAPPTGSDLGALPQFNLVKAKAAYGDKAIYTLQIGVYGRLDLKSPTEADLEEGRKAAEQAVVRLRQEGELAFYYHTRTLSMVTIGVFELSDFDPQVPTYQSARLRETQKRHPYNLYNGAGIKEKGGGLPNRIQPSGLVALPER